MGQILCGDVFMIGIKKCTVIDIELKEAITGKIFDQLKSPVPFKIKR